MARRRAARRIAVKTSVRISGIAAGGDGVGRLADGLAVFVPRTAPGDVADVEVYRRKQRFARARLVSLRTPGSGRSDPPCEHYLRDRCGGCQLQHLSISTQLEVKRKLVGEAVRRIGKRQVEDPPIVPSPTDWRYRSKIRLSVHEGRIGLRPEDQPDSTFQLNDCLIVSERVMDLWRKLREQRRWLPASLNSLLLREDREGTLHVVAVGGSVAWDAGPLAAALDDPSISFWWKPERGAPRVIAGVRTGFPPVAFEQVNTDLAHTIRVAAVDGLGQVADEVVWDLYGGVGDTAELLSQRGARVSTVDWDGAAVEWGKAHGSAGVERIAGRVEEVLFRLPEPGAIAVNPPRTGLDAVVTRFIEQWGQRLRGRRVAYVSCDPATLARDLTRMPSLRVGSLMAYDLFPQTAHVETLAILEAA
jgi:23S rRNA (uracil1939-C5)-methyltransferase